MTDLKRKDVALHHINENFTHLTRDIGFLIILRIFFVMERILSHKSFMDNYREVLKKNLSYYQLPSIAFLI